MSSSQLTEEIASLPPHLQNEVKEFITALKAKIQSQSEPQLLKRQFGAGKGFFKMSDDFDEPLEDFEEYMQPTTHGY
jgi:hypothetical protein